MLQNQLPAGKQEYAGVHTAHAQTANEMVTTASAALDMQDAVMKENFRTAIVTLGTAAEDSVRVEDITYHFHVRPPSHTPR